MSLPISISLSAVLVVVSVVFSTDPSTRGTWFGTVGQTVSMFAALAVNGIAIQLRRNRER